MKRRLNADFRCIHCRFAVTTERVFSGVGNRNHCPYCLYSRHLDLWKPGDRLSACKGKMKPVGLTFKQVRKKYPRQESGELMIIHQCVDCAKVTINRVAADDFTDRLLEVWDVSKDVEPNTWRLLEAKGIQAAREEDWNRVQAQVLGVQ